MEPKEKKTLSEQLDSKLSKKTQKAILYLISIIMVALAFMLVCKPTKANIDILKMQESTLSSEESQLKAMEANIDKNRKETTEMEKEIKVLLVNYPKDIYEEDMVADVLALEEETEIKITDMEIQNTNLMVDDTQVVNAAQAANNAAAATQDAQKAELEAAGEKADNTEATPDAQTTPNPNQAKYQLFQTAMDCSFRTSYEGVKKLFAAVVANAKLKKNIEGVYLSYDTETGNLMGNFIVNYYSMTGEDLDNYVEIDIPQTTVGTTNIFHSVK